MLIAIRFIRSRSALSYGIIGLIALATIQCIPGTLAVPGRHPGPPAGVAVPALSFVPLFLTHNQPWPLWFRSRRPLGAAIRALGTALVTSVPLASVAFAPTYLQAPSLALASVIAVFAGMCLYFAWPGWWVILLASLVGSVLFPVHELFDVSIRTGVALLSAALGCLVLADACAFLRWRPPSAD